MYINPNLVCVAETSSIWHFFKKWTLKYFKTMLHYLSDSVDLKLPFSRVYLHISSFSTVISVWKTLNNKIAGSQFLPLTSPDKHCISEVESWHFWTTDMKWLYWQLFGLLRDKGYSLILNGQNCWLPPYLANMNSVCPHKSKVCKELSL